MSDILRVTGHVKPFGLRRKSHIQKRIMVKIIKPPKRAPPCAFCFNPRDSDEHHFPQWLDKIFPPRTHDDANTQSNYFVDNLRTNPKIRDIKTKTKQGHSRTVAKRSVCKVCNGGWMSLVQDTAMPILIEMILGKKNELSEIEKKTICSWMIMTDMTSEFTHIPTMVITREERLMFKDTKLPPHSWYLCAGRYKGNEWNTRFSHKAVKSRGSSKDPIPESYNGHSTLFVIGELIFYVLGVEEGFINQPDAFINDFTSAFGLMQIWPFTNTKAKWSELTLLSESDIEELSNFILTLSKHEINPYEFY